MSLIFADCWDTLKTVKIMLLENLDVYGNIPHKHSFFKLSKISCDKQKGMGMMNGTKYDMCHLECGKNICKNFTKIKIF